MFSTNVRKIEKNMETQIVIVKRQDKAFKNFRMVRSLKKYKYYKQ